MKNLSLNKSFKPEPGWYRGDFHLHTTHSDGHYSPDGLVDLAKAEGLDFIAVTDHNSIGSFNEFNPASKFLVIPGIEVTFNEGHWNVFGMEEMQDWLEGINGGEIVFPLSRTKRTTTEIMEQAARFGLLNSINHPLLKPWEWQDMSTSLNKVNCLEIWNDPLWPDNKRDNPRAVAMWTEWLNAGYRITAIGGSDFHFLPGDQHPYPGEYPGLPVTYVFAQELSGAAILQGLRRRQVYVSMGPKVSFQARSEGALYDIGADLGELDGQVEFTGTIIPHDQTKTAQIVKNGKVVTRLPVQDSPTSIQFVERANPTTPTWVRLEVLDQDEQVITITNPIFLGALVGHNKATFGDFTY